MTERAELQDSTDEADSPLTTLPMLAFPVVGIGASAGGLAAAGLLLEHLPGHTGMAYVVVLHLSVQHESNAAAILQRSTAMPVLQVTERTPIEPDHVYVVAPGLQLLMEDGALLPRPLEKTSGRHVSVDLFLRTLARAQRERAIAVLLSGTGSDGAVALADLKEHGGVALVQAPSDAEYDGMPRAALATGQVDFVLPVADLPQKLVALWENARRIELPADMQAKAEARPPPDANAAAQAERAVHEVMQMLQGRTGNDFRHYKRATVLRRLERRLQVNGLPDLPAYRTYFENHAEETGPLLRDMLISVTSFFRDRESFEALERELMHALSVGAGANRFRAWSLISIASE